MGHYIDRADVEKRLRRNYEVLYKRDGEVDTDVVDADIAAAEAELDGYLAVRYQVPATGGNAELLRFWALTLCEDLAYGSVPGREVPPNVAERVKSVRAQLALVADGKMSLGTATAPSERSDLAGFLHVEVNEPTFGRDDVKGW